VKSYVSNTINLSWDKILLTSVIVCSKYCSTIQRMWMTMVPPWQVLYSVCKPGFEIGSSFVSIHNAGT
jgi:hypothetical protein